MTKKEFLRWCEIHQIDPVQEGFLIEEIPPEEALPSLITKYLVQKDGRYWALYLRCSDSSWIIVERGREKTIFRSVMDRIRINKTQKGRREHRQAFPSLRTIEDVYRWLVSRDLSELPIEIEKRKTTDPITADCIRIEIREGGECIIISSSSW